MKQFRAGAKYPANSGLQGKIVEQHFSEVRCRKTKTIAMTKSSRIRIYLEVTVLMLLLASCKDDPTETDTGPSELSEEAGNPSKSDGREDRIGNTSNEVVEENRKAGRPSMPIKLREAFKKIEGGAPKLGTFFALWQDAWDGELLAKIEDLKPAVLKGSMLGRRAKDADDVDDVSIFAALRDGESLDGLDRDLAIVVSSVFGGILLDRDLAKDMPLFLEKQMNQLPPVEGDILIIRMAADLSGLIEPVGMFSEAQFGDWKRLRDAANPAYRLASV